jgi:hypothetical protein
MLAELASPCQFLRRSREGSLKNVLVAGIFGSRCVDAFSNIELRDSISRKVHLLITHKHEPAIVAIFRQFIEQAIRDIDPSMVGLIRFDRTPNNNQFDSVTFLAEVACT